MVGFFPKKLLGYFLVISIVTFLVYANMLGNGFVWDDEEQLVLNSVVQNISNLPFLFTASTFNPGGAVSMGGAYYKPLMPLSFMLINSIFGLKAFWFHLFQLLIHLGNSLLVFLILAHLFSLEKVTKKAALPFAFFITLVFAVHPGISEAVFYISATQDVLFAFWGLLSFFLVIYSFEEKKEWFFFLSFFSLFLSFLSKETGFAFIPLIFFYLWLFPGKRVVSWLLGSGLVTGIYLFLRLVVAKIPFHAPHIVPIAQASFLTRLLTIPYELFSYLRLTFFPYQLFIGNHRLISNISDYQFWLYLLVEFFLFIFLIFYYQKIKSKLFVFFFLWFVLLIGPALNIIPADMTVAERWLYLPLVSLVSLTGLILFNSLKRHPFKTYQYLIIILLILLGLRTFIRSFDWRNGLTLYSHDIKQNPSAFDLQNNYGVELFRHGQPQEALVHFEKSIQLKPDWWTPYNNAGVVYEKEKNLPKAKAYYQKAIDNGHYYLAYENLANLMLNTEPLEKTLDFSLESLKVLPLNDSLNRVAALCYYQLGEKQKALVYAKRALTLKPSEKNQAVWQAIVNNREINLQ